jgi:type IV secretion system protein VirB6
VIVDTFYNAPAQLAAAVVGSTDPVATIDAIWERGGSVAGFLWDKSVPIFSDIGFKLAGAIVWCLIGLLCVYAMFLIALSNIALAVLLALGPLFIALWLFEATRRLCVAWLAQLTNYALITVLTVMVAALLLQAVRSYAVQTAALGAAMLTVDALNMALIAVLAFLVLRQVMPIASGLAGGVSLDSFGLGRRMAGGLRGLRDPAKVALKPIAGLALHGARSGWKAVHSTGVSFQDVPAKDVPRVLALGSRWRDRRR